MKRLHNMTRAAMALALAASLRAAGGGPRSLPLHLSWEMRLSSITGEDFGKRKGVIHPVEGVRYSPDGKWIAAVVAHAAGRPGPPSDVLLLPGDGDFRNVKRLPVMREAQSTPEIPGVWWSPTSDSVAVRLRGAGVAVFHLADGAYCEIPAVAVPGGFVRNRLFVAAEKNPAKDPGAFAITVSIVTIYGADCKPVDEWKFRGRIDDLETFAPGLMAIDSDQPDIQVVEPVTGKIVARVSTSGGFTRMRFGEKGRVLCGAWYPSRGSLVCYELATGLRVSHATIQGGAPLDVSLENSLALAADGAFWKNPFGEREYETLKRWIVWDFRTGREIASLGFQMQRRAVHTYWRGNLGPCSSAISPDGRQIAVGGDDLLRVYDLPHAAGSAQTK